MKIRKGFVTNSSSSSFIITNTSNKDISPEEMVMSFFEKILEDARNNYGWISIAPKCSIRLECTDHNDESESEAFIHNLNCSSLTSDKVVVTLEESHH